MGLSIPMVNPQATVGVHIEEVGRPFQGLRLAGRIIISGQTQIPVQISGQRVNSSRTLHCLHRKHQAGNTESHATEAIESAKDGKHNIKLIYLTKNHGQRPTQPM